MGEYVKKIGMRRILIMLLGNVFLGMGVSIFKFAGLGNDAYNAMMMALSDVVGIPYARFFAIFSVGLFVIELIAGRHFIGLGVTGRGSGRTGWKIAGRNGEEPDFGDFRQDSSCNSVGGKHATETRRNIQSHPKSDQVL